MRNSQTRRHEAEKVNHHSTKTFREPSCLQGSEGFWSFAGMNFKLFFLAFCALVRYGAIAQEEEGGDESVCDESKPEES